jgi:hypothetical protein
MKIAYKLLPIVLALFLAISFNCNTTEPPTTANGTLSISLADVSCTEAWVNLKTNSVAFPVNVNFSADGSTVAQLNNLNSSDTTVYIDSLLPNKAYNIQAIIQSTNQYQATTSNKLAVQTLDTTSGNFNWQTYSFGAANAGSSSLNDITIIDANNIWVVGSIYMDDSTGQPDIQPYVLAHWDGTNWQLKKLFDLQNHIIPELRGIYYFSPTDIWLADGGVYHWDGVSQNVEASYDRISLIGGTENGQSVNKLWGTSSSDLYGIGYNGMITHFNGSTWQKIESGTTTTLNDIWGYNDQANNNLSVMTVASNIFSQGDYKLLAISDNTAKDTLDWPYSNWLKGVWFLGKYSPVYICGSGVKEYQQGQWNQLNLPNYFTESIRGSAVNDVIAVGDYGFITHFNGVRWSSENLANNYVFLSVATKNNTVGIAGLSTSGTVAGSAIIVIGKR